MNLLIQLFRQPILLVGFRPFFTLTFIFGVALPLYWIAIYSDWISWFPEVIDPNQWHGHEMYYGFGGALLAGFLLTASKNWVKIRGLHGGPLALAVMFWVIDRFAIMLEPGPLTWILGNLFVVYVMGYLVFSMIKNRAKDFYSDNFLFWIALPLFLVAKNLTLYSETYTEGIAMTTGLFRVVFVIMFERTMAQFMKNAMNCPLPQWPWLDYGIKFLMLLSVGSVFLPPQIAAGLLGITAGLLGFRFLIWKPLVGFQNFGIAVMYLGYLGLTLHVGLEAWELRYGSVGIGALSLHVFTFFCMGMIIPSMLVRICQGHTGRKPIFLARDRFALGIMIFGGLSRVIFTQIWPEFYQLWIGLAGFAWSSCFAILGFRLIPFIWAARIDGKEH